MSFILVINRLDALINRIERLTAAITGVPVDELPPPIAVPAITVVEERLPNRYKLFRIDLSTIHADEPLGIKEILAAVGALYAPYMSIITVPAAFQFKLNSTDSDPIDAAVGLEWADFEITEVFITNAAGAGTALINVEYRVD